MDPACMPTRHREVMKCADSERYASARTARVSVVSAAACCSAPVWAVPAARQRGLHAMGLVVGMPAAFADEHAGMEQAGQGACLGKALALACEIALAALGIRPLRCGVSYAACKTTWELTPAWQARIAGETARAGRAGAVSRRRCTRRRLAGAGASMSSDEGCVRHGGYEKPVTRTGCLSHGALWAPCQDWLTCLRRTGCADRGYGRDC